MCCLSGSLIYYLICARCKEVSIPYLLAILKVPLPNMFSLKIDILQYIYRGVHIDICFTFQPKVASHFLRGNAYI